MMEWRCDKFAASFPHVMRSSNSRRGGTLAKERRLACTRAWKVVKEYDGDASYHGLLPSIRGNHTSL